jgi:threonine/homoserine/homoserine lactone efflux protein
MPDGSSIALFSVAAIILLVIPGPSVLYIITRSIDQGRTAGLVSVLGIHVGTFVHIAAAALGVSAILVRSSIAFSVVRYAGAAYLIYLGCRRLATREDDDIVEAPRNGRGLFHVFRQGVVVNVLNPKTALFFFAFLPQFVDRSRGPVWTQMLFLGGVFVGLGVISDGTYALVSSWAAERLRSSRAFAKVRRYLSGSVFVGLGVLAAVGGKRSNH